MKFAVVVFPGSNCDHDAYYAAKHVLGEEAELIWHKDTSLKGADAVILPGGFAHGDYLRTGAIARFAPIMQAVKAFAAAGGPVLGICNGFQVLLEAGLLVDDTAVTPGYAMGFSPDRELPIVGKIAMCSLINKFLILLPGAMLRNRSLHFRCEHVYVRVEQTDTPFTVAASPRQILRIPIAHGEGNYYAEPDVVDRLERNRQVVFRYVSAAGEATDEANPNGSVHNLAGITNEARNVVGLMPHPERACELAVGSADGLVMFQSVVQALRLAPAAMSGAVSVLEK